MANNATFENWFKITLVIQFAEKGLKDVVQRKVTEWYRREAENIPEECICSTDEGACNEECPSCIKWRTALLRMPRDEVQLSWKNTECTEWNTCDNGWELVKVFMSPIGETKARIKNAKSTDLGGILNLLYNSYIVPVRRNVVKKALNIRNLWAHAANHELTDEDVNQSLDTLTNLLSLGVFRRDEIAFENRKNIECLRHEVLHIPMDIDSNVRLLQTILEDARVLKIRSEKIHYIFTQFKRDVTSMEEQGRILKMSWYNNVFNYQQDIREVKAPGKVIRIIANLLKLFLVLLLLYIYLCYFACTGLLEQIFFFIGLLLLENFIPAENKRMRRSIRSYENQA